MYFFQITFLPQSVEYYLEWSLNPSNKAFEEIKKGEFVQTIYMYMYIAKNINFSLDTRSYTVNFLFFVIEKFSSLRLLTKIFRILNFSS